MSDNVMPVEGAEEVDTLKYGDLIFLYTEDESNGLLSGEGMTSDIVNLKPLTDIGGAPCKFRECLLRIVPQLQYNAHEELYDFEEMVRERGIKGGAVKRMRLYKEESVRKEALYNDGELGRRQGEPVVYGDLVQLQHVLSGRYLQVEPQIPAIIETSCLSMQTSDAPSKKSWFQLNPKYKVRTRGDPVEVSDFTVLMSVFQKCFGQHVHAHDSGEVNCSNDKTAWKVIRFQSFQASADLNQLISVGSVVRLYHSQSQSFLGCRYLSKTKSDSGVGENRDEMIGEDGNEIQNEMETKEEGRLNF
eukprot:g2832.t1